MRANQTGLSLVELMIALGLSLMLLAGLVTIFANASQGQRELQRISQQIENGRYAMDALTQDLHHAGYYGRFSSVTAGTALPDPCITGDQAALLSGMSFPVQGYIAANQTSRPSLAGSSCGTWLTNANLYPGSDVIVIRRAETSALAVGTASVVQEAYLQSNPFTAEIQFGNASTLTSISKADGTAATIFQRDGVTAEAVRKYIVHVYFVAPCSIPSGGGSLCTGSGGEDTIPTLKRLELSASSGSRTFNVVPLAEGIEALKIEYGIDNSPATANASTGQIGDGAPDFYVPNQTTATPTFTDFANAVSAKIFLVARSPEPSVAYTDSKSYPVATPVTSAAGVTLSGTGLIYGPYNDAFRRHAYASEIRLRNLSARRENP